MSRPQGVLQPARASTEQAHSNTNRARRRRDAVSLDDIPGDVLTQGDLAAVLGYSTRTIQALTAAGSFPIQSLPGLGHGRNKHRRWSRAAVRDYLEMRSPSLRVLRHVGSVRR